MAFVYLGFATHPPKQRVPTHFSQKTAWFGWDEPITEYHAPKVPLPYENEEHYRCEDSSDV
jgi:hypothetical protein